MQMALFTTSPFNSMILKHFLVCAKIMSRGEDQRDKCFCLFCFFPFWYLHLNEDDYEPAILGADNCGESF